MTELSPRARLLLERYRASDSLTPHEKQQLLDTMLERAACRDVPRFDVDVEPFRGVPPHVTPRWWASAGGKAAALLGASGVAAAAVLGVQSLQRRPSSAPPDAGTMNLHVVSASDPPSQAEPPTSPVAAPLPAVLAEERPPPTGREPPTRTPSGHRVKGASNRANDSNGPALTDDTIDAEVQLISAAQNALSAGKPQRALALLDEHAARFPNGKLSDARRVARMIALCNAGQRRLALDEASWFLRAYPASPFAGRVQNICAHDPTGDSATH